METVFVIAALKLVGYGLATIGPGLGIGIACYGCCVGTASPRWVAVCSRTSSSVPLWPRPWPSSASFSPSSSSSSL